MSITPNFRSMGPQITAAIQSNPELDGSHEYGVRHTPDQVAREKKHNVNIDVSLGSADVVRQATEVAGIVVLKQFFLDRVCWSLTSE